jgi:hypothetical protein
MTTPGSRPRLLSCVLLLALTSCPRVPANLEVEQPPSSKAERKTYVEAEPNASFEVEVALAGYEQALLALDRVREPGQLYEEMPTYLPDEGLRPLYYWAAKANGVTLSMVGGLFETTVFIDGPHGEDPDYSATDRAGAYNPEFVSRAVEAVRALAGDSARVERTRGAFERQLQRQVVTYWLVYQAIHRDPAWYGQFKSKYAASMGTPNSTFVGYDDLNVMNEAFDAIGLSWYEADTAAYFWVRRDLDGTAELWREAIEALLAAYGIDMQGQEPPGFPDSSTP